MKDLQVHPHLQDVLDFLLLQDYPKTQKQPQMSLSIELVNSICFWKQSLCDNKLLLCLKIQLNLCLLWHQCICMELNSIPSLQYCPTWWEKNKSVKVMNASWSFLLHLYVVSPVLIIQVLCSLHYPLPSVLLTAWPNCLITKLIKKDKYFVLVWQSQTCRTEEIHIYLISDWLLLVGSYIKTAFWRAFT